MSVVERVASVSPKAQSKKTLKISQVSARSNVKAQAMKHKAAAHDIHVCRRVHETVILHW